MNENSLANLNPFKPGQSGNPGGKTSEHRKAEVRAAEAAAKVQAELVEALARVVGSAGDDTEKMDHIRSDVLKLLKDAQDRAFGTPKSSVDLSSEDGTMSPQKATSDAVLDALARKHGVKSENSAKE